MGKRNWDLKGAQRAIGLSGDEVKRKIIFLSDHKLTLGTSGAVDYLKKEHGYRAV